MFPPILIQMKDMWQVTNLTHQPPTTHIHSTHIRKSREIAGNSCLFQGKLASIKAKFLQQIKNDDCLMEFELM